MDADHYSDRVEVGVRCGKGTTRLTYVRLDGDDFGQQLADAESAARVRCVQLNATDRGMKRRLPR